MHSILIYNWESRPAPRRVPNKTCPPSVLQIPCLSKPFLFRRCFLNQFWLVPPKVPASGGTNQTARLELEVQSQLHINIHYILIYNWGSRPPAPAVPSAICGKLRPRRPWRHLWGRPAPAVPSAICGVFPPPPSLTPSVGFPAPGSYICGDPSHPLPPNNYTAPPPKPEP